MSNDDKEEEYISPEERQELIARFGEYRRLPVAQFGRFRVDREKMRHFTFAGNEREFPWYHLVFEIDTSTEFDMMGAWRHMSRTWLSLAKTWPAPIPSRSEVLRAATGWLDVWRPNPEFGMHSLACYRRRVGPPASGQVPTPGDWYIGPLFRRPSNPMIAMDEATPLVEVALRELEQAGSANEAPAPEL